MLSQSSFEPRCLATTLGSLPHVDVVHGTQLMFEHIPDIPAWVQFPRRMWRENMMVQFTESMAGMLEDGEEQVYFNTDAPHFVDALTDFYTHYLAATEAEAESPQGPDAYAEFGLSSQYAAGFFEFLTQLPQRVRDGYVPQAVKGQVTGPITLGLNLLDQTRRSAYYDEQLRDVIIKAVTMNATWQIKTLRNAIDSACGTADVTMNGSDKPDFEGPCIILLDEPSLAGFGSQTLLTVSREDVIHDINEVAEALHAQGALVGVHCEENTDWSLLTETTLDILSFDDYVPTGQHAYLIQLYTEEIRAFLDRGGILSWGIVPTLDRDAAATVTLPELRERFEESVRYLKSKGFDRDLLLRRALITPSCGAGGVLTVPLAERVLGLLSQLSAQLRGA